jgi:hypothetical protein
MSTERDPNAVIAAWLDEGPIELPDPSRRAIVTAAITIPQRRRGLGLPWRFPTMNGYARFALAAVAVVAVALGGIYLLNPAPGGSIGGQGPAPTPSLSPTPTASLDPTPEPANAGTITLTDDGCTWDQPDARWIGTTEVRIDFVNETNTLGNFGFYRLKEGSTWEDAAAYIIALNEVIQAGAEDPPLGPPDFVIDYGYVDTEAFQEGRLGTIVSPGTYGVVCSSNEPPPGAVFAVYLVGPLEVE